MDRRRSLLTPPGADEEQHLGRPDHAGPAAPVQLTQHGQGQQARRRRADADDNEEEGVPKEATNASEDREQRQDGSNEAKENENVSDAPTGEADGNADADANANDTDADADADADDADEDKNDLPKTNNSDDSGEGIPVRVNIPPILLTLSPTTEKLTSDQLKTIHDVTESTIESYLELLNSDNDRNILEDGITFSYVKLLGIKMDQWVSSAGLSYCGNDWKDATNSCKKPCVYGSMDEDDGCPTGQLCYANVKSCGGDDDRKLLETTRRKVLRGGGRRILQSEADDNADSSSSYTVIQLVGGLANFRVVSPAPEPSEKRLGKLTSKAIDKNLVEALQELDDPILAGISDITSSVLSTSDAPALGIPEVEAADAEDNQDAVALDAPPTSTTTGNPVPPTTVAELPTANDPDTDTDTDTAIPPTIETTPTTSGDDMLSSNPPNIEDIPPVVRDPPSESEGNMLPGLSAGPGGNGDVAIQIKTSEEAPSNNTSVVAGVVTGMLLLVMLVGSALLVRSRRRSKLAGECNDFQPHESDLQGSSNEEGSHQVPDARTTSPSAKNRAPTMGTIKELGKFGADNEEEEEGETDESSSETVIAQDAVEALVSPALLTSMRKPRTHQAAPSATATENDLVSISETTVSHTDTSLGHGSPIKPSDSFEIRRHFESITLRKDMMVPAVAAGMESRDQSRVRVVNTELARMPRNVDVEDRGNLITYPRHLKNAGKQQSRTQTGYNSQI